MLVHRWAEINSAVMRSFINIQGSEFSSDGAEVVGRSVTICLSCLTLLPYTMYSLTTKSVQVFMRKRALLTQCEVRRSGVQSVFQVIPRVFIEVESESGFSNLNLHIMTLWSSELCAQGYGHETVKFTVFSYSEGKLYNRYNIPRHLILLCAFKLCARSVETEHMMDMWWSGDYTFGHIVYKIMWQISASY